MRAWWFDLSHIEQGYIIGPGVVWISLLMINKTEEKDCPRMATSHMKINAPKCREPLPTLMQMSTCAYLISTCAIRRVCHFSQYG